MATSDSPITLEDLKKNLSIKIDFDPGSSYRDSYLDVKILFDDEVICETRESFPTFEEKSFSDY